MKLNEPVRAIMILEIMGRPPEHLADTLGKLIAEIEKEKPVKVISKKIGKAQEIKEQKDFYSNFAEIEVEVDELFNLFILVFKYMPAHIDVISPERIEMTNNNWNTILNELARRLHGYDEIARILQMQNAQMVQKLREAGLIQMPNNPVEEKPKKKTVKKKK